MIYFDEQGHYLSQPRPEPPISGDETAMLLGYLERQRATFAWKVSGLRADGLRATLGASSMTLGGMLNHLAHFEDDMSTEWLRGQQQIPPWNTIDWDADPAWDWRTAADDTPAQLYTRWQESVNRSRAQFEEALSNGELGEPGSTITDRRERYPSLRYILLNMIEEYARHNGHADLIRESIDGLVGHDPPE